jgi:hypothetical protein
MRDAIAAAMLEAARGAVDDWRDRRAAAAVKTLEALRASDPKAWHLATGSLLERQPRS